MRCEGSSRLARYAGDAWRVVEAQHIISTRKLVDSDAEQELLEDLIEADKPSLPVRTRRLHFLLATPFRYPPMRHGSRFRARTDPGIWYGAETRRTAFAETAFYRLFFLEGTKAELEPITVELSAFKARIEAQRAADLVGPPFEAHRPVIASPVDYAETQQLGAAMRADGVDVFRYPSARDRDGGVCLGVMDPGVFVRGAREPDQEGWYCVATRARVEISRKTMVRPRETFAFERGEFEIDGVLPRPAA